MAFADPTTPNLPDFCVFIQSNMQIPGSALPINIVAPGNPGLTANTSGGSLPSETVYVKITYVSGDGETTPSPEANIAVTGPTGQVVVASPPALSGATGYNVYAANATGAEVLQTATHAAIATPTNINTLTTGTASPPSTNTANSPWPGYAFNQAMNLVFSLPTIAALDYVLAVYNCAAHILLQITPDVPGQTYFADARKNFNLLSLISGVIQTSHDETTGQSFMVPASLQTLTIADLNFLQTPWGRWYLGYAQSFGAVVGLT